MLDRVQPDQLEVESALTDAVCDARVMKIVLSEAANSPRNDTGDAPKIMVDEETFVALIRACDHLSDSVLEASRVFHREPKP